MGQFPQKGPSLKAPARKEPTSPRKDWPRRTYNDGAPLPVPESPPTGGEIDTGVCRGGYAPDTTGMLSCIHSRSSRVDPRSGEGGEQRVHSPRSKKNTGHTGIFGKKTALLPPAYVVRGKVMF